MMNSENYEININHQDVVFEHLENRFNKLAGLVNTKSISYALILKEVEAIQTIVHAANEIKSNSDRVNSIIQKYDAVSPV